MKIKEIETNSAPDMVVKQILANIEAGDLKPGDRLPTQEKLGEMFGVGRSSIREATNALAIIGYLEITQGRGTFIKSSEPLSAVGGGVSEMFAENADLSNLIELREILECYAIEQAAMRGTEQQLANLKRAVQDLEDCRKEVNNFLQADMAFHQALAKAANNQELGEIIRHIHNATNKRIPVAFTTSRIHNIIKAIDTAQKIYLHIINGESKQAQRCLRNHLEISKEAIASSTLAAPLTGKAEK
jgi:GntR family transcriptional repressor for pyruvate dehydrogenase complex